MKELNELYNFAFMVEAPSFYRTALQLIEYAEKLRKKWLFIAQNFLLGDQITSWLVFLDSPRKGLQNDAYIV